MKIVLALAALAALVASAHATCYCSFLTDSAIQSRSCSTALPSNYQNGYTYTVDAKITDGTSLLTKLVNGSPVPDCDTITSTTSPKKSIADFAAACDGKALCKAFAISDNNGALKVCYYKSTGTSPLSLYDNRCMGVWAKNDPPVVTPGCDCNKYTYGSGAYWKCEDCKRTIFPSADASKCCDCPAKTSASSSDPTGCIDCVVTANPADRNACAACKDYYVDGTNGLVRCWECVKLANTAYAYAMSTLSAAESATYVSDVNGNPPKKWEMCHRFCRMLQGGVLAPRFPGMTDPSQCEDCVKDGGAATFVQVPGNANGQCPSAGRRLAAL